MHRESSGAFTLMGLLLSAALLAGPVRAAPVDTSLEQRGAAIAQHLAAICPVAPRDDVAARNKCADSLRNATFIPFASDGLLWGGDQPDLKLAKKQLTHLRADMFQLMYLSLFTFTGRSSVYVDPREHVGVIRIEAYFRNALPSGEFPYPFWHSAAKWDAYETANQLRFYFNHAGKVFVVTRSRDGDEANRGPWAHVNPPAFDGSWQWTDSAGNTEPRVSLFSNRYSAGNPYLPKLDKAYKDFAIQARNASCLECHAPTNKADATHLVLLQTPMHAAGEIDRVLKEVKNGEMPEDDIGLPKDIDPGLRAAILKTGRVFRETLVEADQWETRLHH
jgi:hypothetical protein